MTERVGFCGEHQAKVIHALSLPNKYQRNIRGLTIDVYDVLKAWGVTNPADAHAIKKLLMPGARGSKDARQDRIEAIQAIERAIELECDE